MNFAEIESAVDARHSVHWSHEGYRVHRDPPGQYLITYLPNGSSIGLTDRSGTKLNGDEMSFFVSRPDLGVTIHCSACGSEDVLRDCWVGWNTELQLWESTDLQDHAFCRACDGEAILTKRTIRDYGAASGFSSSGCVPVRTIAEKGQGTGACGEVAGTDLSGVSCCTVGGERKEGFLNW
ncbi:MAG: hypothetical protein CML50_09315 [Rhodobacteraceae bacterium]|uniref:hypothetical protein n=1 Tax=Roseobacteraceae TaxID=2854170 RepID=UPI000978768C|nr:MULTISPECIES: hypothetical protein [Salipiger]MAB06198.1 hypothetical protein [Paracoccaceae bacterium]GGA28687.1 hypothetical protein GCM10011326_45910 [Salipiger profundus]HCR94807.1 hypothetical protein [Oceanicaulis sp.]